MLPSVPSCIPVWNGSGGPDPVCPFKPPLCFSHILICFWNLLSSYLLLVSGHLLSLFHSLEWLHSSQSVDLFHIVALQRFHRSWPAHSYTSPTRSSSLDPLYFFHNTWPKLWSQNVHVLVHPLSESSLGPGVLCLLRVLTVCSWLFIQWGFHENTHSVSQYAAPQGGW